MKSKLCKSQLSPYFLFLIPTLFFFNCLNLGFPQGQGPTGFIYSKYRLAVSPAHQLEEPEKFKLGKSCLKRIGFFYTNGNASTESAAEQGNIEKIYSIDREIYQLLLIYTEFCTIVKGT